MRWSRTIRISRPGGYFGYLVTQATFWCAVAAMNGYPRIAMVGAALRLMAAAASMRALGVPRNMLLLVPLRDLFGLAVWAAGMLGNTVEWRGIRFRLLSDGRIRRLN